MWWLGIWVLILSGVWLPTHAATVTLLYTGNLDGELEPCGCSLQGDLGGLKRHTAVLDDLRAQHPDLVVVGSGGLLKNESIHDRLTGDFILQGVAQQNFDALGVQWTDLAYGAEFIRAAKLPWVASNWRGEGFASQKLIERGEQRIAFFSWLDPDVPAAVMMHSSALGPGSETAALAQALAQAKKDGALTILSTTFELEQAQRRFPLRHVDVLLVKSAYEVYGKPRKVGSTLVLQPGSRGMRFGLATLTFDAKARVRDFQHRVLEMPASITDAPRMKPWYDAYNEALAKDYQARVEQRKKILSPENPFVGANECQACHETQFKVWTKTRHAHAFATLKRVNKAFDPNCIKCHTVGFEQPGGYLDEATTEHLQNVQCEACHGAARAHVTSGGTQKVTNAEWSRSAMCAQCHTPQHSPAFDVKRYWPKIAHGRARTPAANKSTR